MPSTSTQTPEKWWQVSVTCDLALEDSVYWAFDQIGSKGTASQTQDDRRIITAYLPQVQFQASDLEQFKADLIETSPQPVNVNWQLIDGEDWAKSWKSHWQAEEIGDRLLINPAWMIPPVTERTILTLDPGSAFGTGAHATTQLCLKALETHHLQGATIADIGCGSGILSIVALLYGAKQAYAADVDPLAVQSTRANATLNQVPETALQVQLGSVAEVINMAEVAGQSPINGIVCNILAEVIVDLIIPHLSKLANAETWGILSGILTTKAPWVESHLNTHGWQVTHIEHQDEWCVMSICLASELASEQSSYE